MHQFQQFTSPVGNIALLLLMRSCISSHHCTFQWKYCRKLCHSLQKEVFIDISTAMLLSDVPSVVPAGLVGSTDFTTSKIVFFVLMLFIVTLLVFAHGLHDQFMLRALVIKVFAPIFPAISSHYSSPDGQVMQPHCSRVCLKLCSPDQYIYRCLGSVCVY
jgi:hypothetical protein